MGNNSRRVNKHVKTNKRGAINKRKRERGVEEMDNEIDIKQKGSNDPKWYAGDVQMLNNVANFPYHISIGERFNLAESFDGDAKPVITDQSIPGIMVLDIVSGPGITKQLTDAPNIAARILYTAINSMNSRDKSYDPVDLFLDICAVDEMYAYIAYIKRTYGLINTYSVYNKYYPKAIVEALGFDFEDLLQHMPDLVNTVNNWILQLGTFVTPEGWNYLKRHQFLYSNVYADSPSAKAQTYAFRPYGFRRYTETEGAGKLKYVSPYAAFTKPAGSNSWSPQPINFNRIKTFGDNLLEAIATSQDCATMSADILKATNSYMTEDLLSNDYCVTPVYVPEVLAQIENATINSWLRFESETPDKWDDRFDITQNPATGCLQYDPGTSTPMGKYDMLAQSAGRVLNMRMDNPSPEMNMVATRLMNVADIRPETAGQARRYSLNSCGTEIVVGCQVYNYHMTSTGKWEVEASDNFNYANLIYTPNDVCKALKEMNLINQFAWHPCVIYSVSVDGDTFTDAGAIRLMETDNYTTLTKQEIKKLHDVALLGEFQIGQNAGVVK